MANTLQLELGAEHLPVLAQVRMTQLVLDAMAIAHRELHPLLAPKVKVGVRGKSLEDEAQGPPPAVGCGEASSIALMRHGRQR
jgi:hypothetical protein